jgi:hypothetical protein
MNLKQGRAQRHEMRTRERDRPLAFGARVGIVLQHRRSVDRTCIESLREEASTKHARVGWCDQLLDAVVMVKSDMVLGVDRDNEREGSGGRRLMQHEGTVHVPRDAGSRALSFTEACVASS